MIACVSAAETFIPPTLIFPRVHVKEHMLDEAPPGTLRTANQSVGSESSSSDIIELQTPAAVAGSSHGDDKVTPEQIRPFPKAPPRKESKRGGKTFSSFVKFLRYKRGKFPFLDVDDISTVS
ncbi:hypothetical protein ILUMI_07094 [Ignelater luminosus]|uniref:Uncharacterized protein n=1 Tax=Ignelater luminosus TaxID=2038154 RepID=A0A8K0GID7_IGNLU|nr:hypothetical protein ILUMI_07094 [Ignelater luminosus]